MLSKFDKLFDLKVVTAFFESHFRHCVFLGIPEGTQGIPWGTRGIPGGLKGFPKDSCELPSTTSYFIENNWKLPAAVCCRLN